ncbi:UDP-3-O-(3-hydroxymyristoyl)glucosamine N-acyltransferase [Thalassotalea sp. HSM 43]|uniref:UDP-3-O-(3-hydroxymyristoyl)glucosamine N-acyltransferase n=1 Tax=Thalassotalea sp. HSM 43 TaxID=2552945 RepID=UPI001081C9E7|nr:UDP-3-O-(3-hydroxymyristoyl)glucosamine N-acyltransferase [Thalassotalea sp. HSM 43]QBY05538.1 UDP-3-O-(3-hydroxymyristoyl)glucosamine N-acyltransferase [Thalassotalea sp. HSM 43]
MVTLGELARQLGGSVQGDESTQIHSLGTLTDAKSGQIAFLANAKYRQYLEDTQASAVIVSKAHAKYCSTNALVLDNPYLGFAKVAQLLDTTPKAASDIAPTAVISDDVRLGEGVCIGANSVIESGVILGDNVIIGANCFIGKDAKIGRNSQLWSNVSIYHRVELGSDCLVQANTAIGSDGFGYANDKGIWEKIPQLGTVLIGNSVEIGACTTIDRGALENTEIDDNCIIDNQVQIAHNVKIGYGTAIAGCTVVAGSTKVGKHCIIAGMVAITGHVEIADGTSFTGMSMVTKGIKEPGLYSSGIPALTNKEWRRNASRYKHLNEMYKRLQELEKQVEELNNKES